MVGCNDELCKEGEKRKDVIEDSKRGVEISNDIWEVTVVSQIEECISSTSYLVVYKQLDLT